jgi:biopolymer transport protein ExbD
VIKFLIYRQGVTEYLLFVKIIIHHYLMRIAAIFISALMGIQPLLAEEPTIESLALKIDVLEQKVAALSAQVAASTHIDQPAPDGALVIHVLVDGSIEVGGESVSDAEVAKKLQAISMQVSDQPLQIRASKEAKYQDIVRVIELCQKSGISDISFATTEIPDEQAGTGQPATRSQSKSEGGDKLQQEAEGRSR